MKERDLGKSVETAVLLFKHKTNKKTHLFAIFGFFPHYSKKQNKEGDSQFDSLPPLSSSTAPPPPVRTKYICQLQEYTVFFSAKNLDIWR